jgi:metallo-beta-lactamase class B
MWFRTLVLAAMAASGCAANKGIPAAMLSWTEEFPAFTIAGNLHYVGTNDVAMYLVTTPAGHILLDTGFEARVPQLERSVAALGFKLADVKIILSSHAHIDHVQAHARVRALTGARVLVSERDAPAISSGGRNEWAYDDFAWTPCPVDGLVRDGDRIALGGTVMTAHMTPGHSLGATTWTTTVADSDGRERAVIFFPSATVPPGAQLVGNLKYPDAIADYRRSFALWRRLPCDYFLAAHASFFGLEKKWKRWKTGERPNPFIDPAGFKATLDEQQERFEAVVQSQS